MKQKPTVLFVPNQQMGDSGSAYIHYVMRILDQCHGYDVHAAVRSGGTYDFFAKSTVTFHEIQADSHRLSDLRKLVWELQPQFVHTLIHGGCGFYPLLLRAPSRPRFILDIRSPLIMPLGTHPMRRWLVRMKKRLEAMPYDAIISHGIESAWTVIGTGFDIHHIPPGIDLQKIPSKMGLSTPNSNCSPVRLIYIGSLDEKRRIDRLFAAVEQASMRVPLSLDLYGDGSGKAPLLQMVAQSDLRERVRFMPVIPREELFAQLPTYDIGLSYIPKTLYDTAIPLKTLEYLSSGLPTIATNTMGNRAVIQHGVNGYLAAEEPDQMATAIVDLVQNKKLQQHLVQNARKSVSGYDWKDLVRERLLPLYEQLLVR